MGLRNWFNLQELMDYSASLPSSKRSILKITSKIFDPLGFLSPFVIQLKVLFQTLCKKGSHWDDLLQQKELEICQSFWIQVTLQPQSPKILQQCYIYVRIFLMEEWMYRSCLLKAGWLQSNPRFELLGALILSRLSSSVLTSLPSHVETFFWTAFFYTDSMTETLFRFLKSCRFALS